MVFTKVRIDFYATASKTRTTPLALHNVCCGSIQVLQLGVPTLEAHLVLLIHSILIAGLRYAYECNGCMCS